MGGGEEALTEAALVCQATLRVRFCALAIVAVNTRIVRMTVRPVENEVFVTVESNDTVEALKLAHGVNALSRRAVNEGGVSTPSIWFLIRDMLGLFTGWTGIELPPGLHGGVYLIVVLTVCIIGFWGYESLKKIRMKDEKKILRISFGDGVGLYPGGGVGVTHYFYISDSLLIYAKNVGWNS